MRNVKRTIRASAKDVIADIAPPPQWIEPELCPAEKAKEVSWLIGGRCKWDLTRSALRQFCRAGLARRSRRLDQVT